MEITASPNVTTIHEHSADRINTNMTSMDHHPDPVANMTNPSTEASANTQ